MSKWLRCLPTVEVFHELVTYNRNHDNVEIDFFLELTRPKPDEEQYSAHLYKAQLDNARHYFFQCVKRTPKNPSPCFPIRVHWADPVETIVGNKLIDTLNEISSTDADKHQVVHDFAKKHEFDYNEHFAVQKEQIVNALKDLVSRFPVVVKELKKIKRSNEFGSFADNYADWTYYGFLESMGGTFSIFRPTIIWFLLRCVMDIYYLARMLKPRESTADTPKNIILYAGSVHTTYCQFYLQKLGFKVAIDERGYKCDKDQLPQKFKSFGASFVRSRTSRVTQDTNAFLDLCDKLLLKRDINGVLHKAHLHHKNGTHVILIGEHHHYTQMKLPITASSLFEGRRVALVLGLDKFYNDHAIEFLTTMIGRREFTVFDFATSVGQEVFKKNVSRSDIKQWFPNVPVVIVDGYFIGLYWSFVGSMIDVAASRQFGDVDRVAATNEELAAMEKLQDEFAAQKQQEQMSAKRRTAAKPAAKVEPAAKPVKQPAAKPKTPVKQPAAKEWWTRVAEFRKQRRAMLAAQPTPTWKQTNDNGIITYRFPVIVRAVRPRDVSDEVRFQLDNWQHYYWWCVAKSRPAQTPQKLGYIESPEFRLLKDDPTFLEAVEWAHDFVPKGKPHAKPVEWNRNVFTPQFMKDVVYGCIPLETSARGDGACMIHACGYFLDVAQGVVGKDTRRAQSHNCVWAYLLRNLLTDIEWKAGDEFNFNDNVENAKAFTKIHFGNALKLLDRRNADFVGYSDEQANLWTYDNYVKEMKRYWKNWSNVNELHLVASILCIDITVLNTAADGKMNGPSRVHSSAHYPVHQNFRRYVRGHGILHFTGVHFDVIKFTHYPAQGQMNSTASRDKYASPNTNGCLRMKIAEHADIALLAKWGSLLQEIFDFQGPYYKEHQEKDVKQWPFPPDDIKKKVQRLMDAEIFRFGSKNKWSVKWYREFFAACSDFTQNTLENFKRQTITGQWIDALFSNGGIDQGRIMAIMTQQFTIKDLKEHVREFDVGPNTPPRPKHAAIPLTPLAFPRHAILQANLHNWLTELEKIITTKAASVTGIALELNKLASGFLFVDNDPDDDMQLTDAVIQATEARTHQVIEEIAADATRTDKIAVSAAFQVLDQDVRKLAPLRPRNLIALVRQDQWLDDATVDTFLALVVNGFRDRVGLLDNTKMLHARTQKANQLVRPISHKGMNKCDFLIMCDNNAVPKTDRELAKQANHFWINVVDLKNHFIVRCDSMNSADAPNYNKNMFAIVRDIVGGSFDQSQWTWMRLRSPTDATKATQSNGASHDLALKFVKTNEFPRQTVSHCGVYACIAALHFMCGKPMKTIVPASMLGWRLFMLKSLLGGKLWHDPAGFTADVIGAKWGESVRRRGAVGASTASTAPIMTIDEIIRNHGSREGTDKVIEMIDGFDIYTETEENGKENWLVWAFPTTKEVPTVKDASSLVGAESNEGTRQWSEVIYAATQWLKTGRPIRMSMENPFSIKRISDFLSMWNTDCPYYEATKKHSQFAEVVAKFGDFWANADFS